MDNENLDLQELLKVKEVISIQDLKTLNKKLSDGYKIIAIEKLVGEVSGDELIYYHIAQFS